MAYSTVTTDIFVTNYSENNNTRQSKFDEWAETMVGTVYVLYVPFLVIFGLIGNSISMFVFCTTKKRFQSTSYYLSALAFSDTMFLLQLVPPWLGTMDITRFFHHRGSCEVFVFISYVTSCYSAWLVVAFTIERFVAVLYPLQRNVLCTSTRAKYVIIILAALSIILNLPVLRFTVSVDTNCEIDGYYMKQAARFNVFDAVFSFTIPLFAITMLNAWIVVGIIKIGRMRDRVMQAQVAVKMRGFEVDELYKSAQTQQRVTRMLLIVSTVYVSLNLPASVMRLVAYAYDVKTLDEFGARYMALQQLCLLFFNTNFGINFFLYCISGKNFRHMLASSCRRQKPQIRREGAIRRNGCRPGCDTSLSSSSFGVGKCIDETPCTAADDHYQNQYSEAEECFNSRLRSAHLRLAMEAAAKNLPIPMDLFDSI